MNVHILIFYRFHSNSKHTTACMMTPHHLWQNYKYNKLVLCVTKQMNTWMCFRYGDIFCRVTSI